MNIDLLLENIKEEIAQDLAQEQAFKEIPQEAKKFRANLKVLINSIKSNNKNLFEESFNSLNVLIAKKFLPSDYRYKLREILIEIKNSYDKPVPGVTFIQGDEVGPVKNGHPEKSEEQKENFLIDLTKLYNEGINRKLFNYSKEEEKDLMYSAENDFSEVGKMLDSENRAENGAEIIRRKADEADKIQSATQGGTKILSIAEVEKEFDIKALEERPINGCKSINEYVKKLAKDGVPPKGQIIFVFRRPKNSEYSNHILFIDGKYYKGSQSMFNKKNGVPGVATKDSPYYNYFSFVTNPQNPNYKDFEVIRNSIKSATQAKPAEIKESYFNY